MEAADAAAASPTAALLTTGQEDRETKKNRHMRGRVCAAHVRAPQAGVAALVLLGGALAGAAVVAWRHRRGARPDGGNSHELPRKEEVLDGGVEENEEGGVSLQKFELSDENLIKERTEIGVDELVGEAVQKFDQNSNRDGTDVTIDELDSEGVENFDQNSSRERTENTADELDSGDVGKFDENVSHSDTGIPADELDGKLMENFDQTALNISSSDIPDDNGNNHHDSSQEIALQKTALNISSSDIPDDNGNNHHDGSQEIALQKTALNISSSDIPDDNGNNHQDGSQEIALQKTALNISSSDIPDDNGNNHQDGSQEIALQKVMHQEQVLKELKLTKVTVATETEVSEGVVTQKEVTEEEEQKKVLTESDKPDSTPTYSSLLSSSFKMTKQENVKPAFVEWDDEMEMKLEQDKVNVELKDNDWIKGATQGVLVAMNRTCDFKVFVVVMLAFAIVLAVLEHSHTPFPAF